MVLNPFSIFNIIFIFILTAVLTVIIGFPILEFLVFNPEGETIITTADEALDLLLRPKAVLVFLAIQNSILIFLVYLRVIKLGGHKPEELGITSDHFFQKVGIGLFLGFILLIVVFAISFALAQFDLEQEPPFGIPETTAELGMILIAGVIFAPIGEEIFFRAYIITALKERYPRYFAFSFSAVFFAIVHFSLEALRVFSLPSFLTGIKVCFPV
jgi:membrane protease YdiL (CAAX protease family)